MAWLFTGLGDYPQGNAPVTGEGALLTSDVAVRTRETEKTRV
jgi:hypothetical protein